MTAQIISAADRFSKSSNDDLLAKSLEIIVDTYIDFECLLVPSRRTVLTRNAVMLNWKSLGLVRRDPWEEEDGERTPRWRLSDKMFKHGALENFRENDAFQRWLRRQFESPKMSGRFRKNVAWTPKGSVYRYADMWSFCLIVEMLGYGCASSDWNGNILWKERA